MSTPHAWDQSRLAVRTLVSLGLAAVVVLVAGCPVAAQGPYGGTSTTAVEASETPRCDLDQSSGAVGSAVDGTVTGVEPGVELDVFFAGTLVTETTAGDAPSGARTAFRFTVPDVDSGEYQVVVVGTTFNVSCEGPDGEGTFLVSGEVLSGGANRDGADADRRSDPEVAGSVDVRTGVDAGPRGRGLPFTGASILGLVVLGVVLVAVGWFLRRRAGLRTASGPRSVQRPW